MIALEGLVVGSVRLVLGSKSPRRSELLSQLDIEFVVRTFDCEETFPEHLSGGEIAKYLSGLKSNAFRNLEDDELLLTADTIVWMNNRIYEKPKSEKDAEAMLGELSGNEHHVYTGVTLKYGERLHSFVSVTKVKFENFASDTIAEYVKVCQPLDKAGAYGIQDCLTEDGEHIGPLTMSIVEGSYNNVIGLPVEDLKVELSRFELT